MNFIDNLSAADSNWNLGDVIVAGLNRYMIIKSSGVGTSSTLFYLINVATMEAYISASSLNTAPDSLKQKFITMNPATSISKVIPQAWLTLVADEV